jgi:hypothetical protein
MLDMARVQANIMTQVLLLLLEINDSISEPGVQFFFRINCGSKSEPGI